MAASLDSAGLVRARAWNLVRLLRPITLPGVYLEVTLGAYLSGDAARSAVGPGVATALLLGFAQVTNDIFDKAADEQSGKGRPLATGFVTAQQARVLAFLLLLGGVVVCALTTAVLPTAIALVLTAGSVVYSWKLKGTVLLGNLLTAFLSSVPVVYGSFVGGGVNTWSVVAWLYIFAFLFAYEILKTLRDAREDTMAGLQTIATVLSAKGGRLFYTLACVPVLSAPLIPTWIHVNRVALFVAVMLLGVCVPVVIANVLVQARSRSRSWSRAVLAMQLCWLPAMYAFSLFRR